ncbi:winged helix-turn-helix domain-containing protein [Streptomyces sp. NPDC006510]|uniref:helix-turn-helix domain-containing protein n=1 Tax=Streptomyces sp. NPDC006510 TaxID=3155600 RepID=UPI0033AA7A34
MLLRLAYSGMANAFAMLRLLPMSDRDKDVEILALRHQLSVLERQLGSGVTRLLHRMGCSVQMPARPAAERDEDAITAWREATWREVKPSGRRPARSSASRTKRA